MDRALALYLPAVYVVEESRAFFQLVENLRVGWCCLCAAQRAGGRPGVILHCRELTRRSANLRKRPNLFMPAGRIFLHCRVFPGESLLPCPRVWKQKAATAKPACIRRPKALWRESVSTRECLRFQPALFRWGALPEAAGRMSIRFTRVFLKEFYIAKYETTVEQYCRFLNEAGLDAKDGLPRVNLNCAHCPIRKKDKSFRPVKGMANVPMVCVSWNGCCGICPMGGRKAADCR